MGVQESVIETLKSMSVFNDIVESGAANDADEALAKAEAAVAEADQQLKILAMVECAYLIASADGSTSAEELGHIKENISAISDGAIAEDAVGAYIEHAEKMVNERGRDESIALLAERLDEGEEREAAFIAGASAAWTGGGVGAQEGLCMQAIARAFGWEISHMHQLLGKARG
jgi:hypothetical protein